MIEGYTAEEDCSSSLRKRGWHIPIRECGKECIGKCRHSRSAPDDQLFRGYRLIVLGCITPRNIEIMAYHQPYRPTMAD